MIGSGQVQKKDNIMIIKKFESFRGGFRSGTTELGPLQKKVEIRIDLEKVEHTSIQQYRHGFTKSTGKIEDDDIRGLVEEAIEEITIALMQDQFDIVTKEDNYPTPGIKAGQPNRFVIRDKETKLNVVCELKPGVNEFTLTVITVMTKENFKIYPGQWIVEI